jgi:hypothetical protein
LATSTLRFVIVVALVVGGVVLINSAFPDNGGSSTLPAGGGPSQSVSPPASPSRSPKPPKSPATPQLVGMDIAVFNGTSVTGLAGGTAEDLQKQYGVVPIQVEDAPSPVSVTTIYYRTASDKDEAEFLATDYFKKISPEVAKLEPGSGVDKDAQLAIYLGTDYATATS